MIEPIKLDLEEYSIIVSNKTYRNLVNKVKEYQNGYNVAVSISGLKEYEYPPYEHKVIFSMEIGEEIPSKTKDLINELFSNKIQEINEKIKEYNNLRGEVDVLTKKIKE